ncbi:MAG: AAA family ATPase [Candidatus Gastranaerophilales bacterium]|nr:AAA family ATPase [Candidatus Gastranaerophilales bacterium]
MSEKVIKDTLNNRYVKNFLKDRKLILIIISVVMFWALFYLLTFYDQTYRSKAKILIKDISTQEFVTDLTTESDVRSLTSVGNPILNQIEILKSYQLSDFLFHYIKEYYPDRVKFVRNEEKYIKKILKAKNKGGTDVILVSLDWNNPKQSQELLNIILNKYQEINLNMNKEIRSQRRAYIDKKVAELEAKLLDIRTRIKNYKIDTLAIDIDQEAKGLINQQLLFSTKLEDNYARYKSAASRVKELESQLSLKARDAVNAVALGWQNSNLVDLRSKLYDALQAYSYDSIKYAQTSPKMIAQKNKIATLKSEINEQVELSLGKSKGNRRLGIFDTVRAGLVNDLVQAKTDLMSLDAEGACLRNSINKIKGEKTGIPEKKYNLDNLQQEESNISIAYNELKKKQIEAKIKEAEAISNTVIIDPANYPKNAAFPTILQVLAIAMILGINIGLASSALKTYIEDICEGDEAIEEVTKGPILGTLLWLKDQNNPFSIRLFKIAYENILSNFIIRCFNKDSKVISFTSSSITKRGSTIIYTLATELRKSGHNVVVVDTDFRSPTLLKDANMTDHVKINLSEMIISIEKDIKQNKSVDPKLIISSLLKDKNGLFLLGNKSQINEPYEYYGTIAFSLIIKALRDHFEWVLIDTSPATVAPEFSIISRLCDGVVLLTNYTATYSTLSKITKIFTSNNIPFIGSIIRKKDATMEKEYTEFTSDRSLPHRTLKERKTVRG